MSNLYYDGDQPEYEMLDGFRAFSFKHIALGDVDPIYTMIRNADMTDNQKKRMMFSHLMVYDLKSSIPLCSIDDTDLYYDEVYKLFKEEKVGKDRKDVASRETNPKSRTFGTQIPKMRTKSPEEWVDIAINEVKQSLDWGKSIQASKEVPTFGEYFAFKLSDMIETIFEFDGYNVKYDSGFLKSMPRGALTGYEMVRTGSRHKFRDKEEIRKCVDMKSFYDVHLEFFSSYACPHKPTRKIGVTEIETLLCDYRKMCKGTLKHGDKVYKLKEALNKYPDLEVSNQLLVGAMPMFERRSELLEMGTFKISEEHCFKF